MLAADGGAWRLRDAVASAVAWGFGASVGVLGGAFLTSVGTQGAPGPAVVDVRETTLVPIVAGFVVASVRVFASVAAAVLRGIRNQPAAEQRG